MISIFISGITDPYLHMTVKIQQNNYGSQMDAVIAVRKQEREISRKKSNDRNLKNRLQRMVIDDEGFSGD